MKRTGKIQSLAILKGCSWWDLFRKTGLPFGNGKEDYDQPSFQAFSSRSNLEPAVSCDVSGFARTTGQERTPGDYAGLCDHSQTHWCMNEMRLMSQILLSYVHMHKENVRLLNLLFFQSSWCFLTSHHQQHWLHYLCNFPRGPYEEILVIIIHSKQVNLYLCVLRRHQIKRVSEQGNRFPSLFLMSYKTFLPLPPAKCLLWSYSS